MADSIGAHPRVGGENHIGNYGMVEMLGSSPRGRGKHPESERGRGRSRLIPAWAGKTPRPIRPRARSWAHPRVGGENAEPKRDPLGVAGSSPRGRGKLCRQGEQFADGGLIPAWAGKTSRETRCSSG